MTLREIWAIPARNMSYVAFIPGELTYVAIGHKTPERALESAGMGMTVKDVFVPHQGCMDRDDWKVGEIVPYDPKPDHPDWSLRGQVKDIEER